MYLVNGCEAADSVRGEDSRLLVIGPTVQCTVRTDRKISAYNILGRVCVGRFDELRAGGFTLKPTGSHKL